MGDIADGLVDGSFDSITGEYLGEGPGYPRSLEWKSENNRNTDCIRGVKMFLRKKGIENKYQYNFCIEYLNLKLNKTHKDVSWLNVSFLIQKDFKHFASYTQNKIKS